MPSRMLLVATGVVAGALILSFRSDALAKTCRDEVVARSRSAGLFSEGERTKIARKRALSHWRFAARSTYGIGYQFWSRAADKSIDCRSEPDAVRCVARGKPCRLL